MQRLRSHHAPLVQSVEGGVMPRIRWEKDYEDEFTLDYVGYIGKALIASMVYDMYEENWWLHFAKEDSRKYTSLKSA